MGLIPQHVKAQQETQWIESVVRFADRVSSAGLDANEAELALFVIRLYETLVAIGSEYSGPKVSSISDETERLLARRVAVCFDQLRSSMSEDELVWLDHRRQTETHPWQDKFDDPVKKRRTPAGEFLASDIDRRITAIESGGTGRRIGLQLAQRLLPVLRALLDADRILTSCRERLARDAVL